MHAPTPTQTDLNEMRQAFTRLRVARDAHTLTLAERRARLTQLRAGLLARMDALCEALSADFGHRAKEVSQLADGFVVLGEIDHALKHLRAWMRPRRAPVNTLFLPASGEIRAQPIGVVGIIAPWNYPVQLILVPLISAIAAGCRVMLKPSEFTPRTNAMLRQLLDAVFSDEEVVMVEGDHKVSSEFSALPFDHLFFTGSTAVGKLVMAAAAKNLTPVTLELGGKSPVIIAPDYPLQNAVNSIAQGKWFNAGQTCIAPDYVLLHPAQVEGFVEHMQAWAKRSHPDAANDSDYTRVINQRQHARLQGWLEEAKAKGARVIELSSGDANTRCMPPTLVLNAPADCQLMQEEIFGPILLVMPCDGLDAAMKHILQRDRPLALYVFDNDRSRVNQVLDKIVCGGVTVNDTLLHFAQKSFPTGGVGASGMGAYHGKTGFDCFTKYTGVFHQARLNGVSLFAPPYSAWTKRLLKWLLR